MIYTNTRGSDSPAEVLTRHSVLLTAQSAARHAGTTAKLHYMDTGYGHHQPTSSQQFYNLLYNKVTTNGHKFATSQHLDMSRCWALVSQCGKFVVQQVVELL